MEKYLTKKNKLYLALVDLGSSFDGVPSEVMRWVTKKSGVAKSLVQCRYVIALWSEHHGT